MRKLKMRIIALNLICIMLMGTGALSFASAKVPDEDYEDYAPVIGEYIYDAELEVLAAEKERTAKQYYNSKLSRSMTAEENLNIFAKKQVTTPLLKEGSPSLYAKTRRLAIFQNPQEKYNWCGYAAIQSLLDYEGISKTQNRIARDVYKTDYSCPWYLSNGNDRSQFPVPVYLTDQIDFYYIPYPKGAAGTTDITGEDIDFRIVSTIDSGHGVMACGISYGNKKNDPSILPGYPARKIGHWIAIDGYQDYGDEIWIIDPAKSEEVSWSDDISRYYSISADKLAAFSKSKGIVY